MSPERVLFARFHVPGAPYGQPRARAVIRGTKGKMKGGVYTPGTADSWKAQVVQAAQWSGFYADKGEAVSLTISFRFLRPQSHHGTGRNRRKLRPSAPAQHAKAPDINNLVKTVEDALKGHLWRDDSQVASYGAMDKRWTTSPHEQGAYVEVRLL